MLWLAVWLLLPAIGITSLVLAAVVGSGERLAGARRAASVLDAALLGLVTAALVLYVAGEDDYRMNGMTRWEAYDVRPLTVSAVVAGALGVAGVAIGAWRSSRWIGVTSLLVCALAALLQLAAFVANTAN